jgi:chromosome segregation ATPase
MAKAAPPSPLRDAAESLDRELDRYAALADDLRREPATSEKSLRRSGRLLQNLSDSEALLRQHLGGLVAAIDARRRQQEATADEVVRLTATVQGRTELFDELLRRCDALAKRATQANLTLQRRAEDGTTGDENLDAFEETAAGLQELVTEAQAIGDAARAGDFPDVARQTEGLRAQLASARQKLLATCERYRQGRVVH